MGSGMFDGLATAFFVMLIFAAICGAGLYQLVLWVAQHLSVSVAWQ
jgi:hypothetical protein